MIDASSNSGISDEGHSFTYSFECDSTAIARSSWASFLC